MVLADLPDPKPTRVVTTLDAALQRTIEGIVRSQRPLLEKHGATNVAIVVLDNTTSQWLAWEGSGNYGGDRGGTDQRPDRAAPARLGAEAVHLRARVRVGRDSGDGAARRAGDFPDRRGRRDLHAAQLRRALPRAAAGAGGAGRLDQRAGGVAGLATSACANVLRFLRRAGFTTFDKTAAHYGLGLTLGNAEVRLDELTAAYAAFARGGEWRAPRARLDPEPRLADPVQLVSPRTAYWITDILADDEARAFIFGRGSQLDFPFPVAVKTGTSQAYHDNWTVGSSRHVTVGVWVGNFDRSPLIGSSGVTGAGPLFHAVMLAAEARVDRRDHAERRRRAGSAGDAGRGHDLRAVGHARRRCLSGAAARAARAGRARRSSGAACTWHHGGDGELVTIWPERYRAWADANGLRSPVERRAEVRLAPACDHDRRRAAPSARGWTPRRASCRRHRVPDRSDLAARVPGAAVPRGRRRRRPGVVDGERPRRRDRPAPTAPCCGRSSAAHTSPSSATPRGRTAQVSFIVK